MFINYCKEITRIKHEYMWNMFNNYVNNYLSVFCLNENDQFYFDYPKRLSVFFHAKKQKRS